MRIQTSLFANEQSFEILQGSTSVFTSPVLVNNELRNIETCLPFAVSNLYNLNLKDSYGDSWSDGSWLEIQGKYGNIVYKGFMVAIREESYQLSLYTPVQKQSAEWKLTSSIVNDNWTAIDFVATGWSDVTLGSVIVAVTGTQYFRKAFVGLSEMAAYQLSINYRFGIIAYIGGLEVFRDNMPSGPVQSSTAASGSYSIVDYHGIIRPAIEITSSTVLAIELHFTSTIVQTIVDLDAYLAIYASGSTQGKCYMYPYALSVNSNSGDGVKAMNWNKGDYLLYNNPSASFPSILTITPLTSVIPFVNSIRIWPSGSPGDAPGNFILSGSSTSTGQFTSVINGVGRFYLSKVYNFKNSFYNAASYPYWRMTISAVAASSNLYLYDMSLATCNLGSPTTILYPKSSYSFIAVYDNVVVAPFVDEFFGCQITPSLPEGLSMNPNTCIVTGKASGASSQITYTVTSTTAVGLTGTFSLTITICEGTMFEMRRIYKLNSRTEGYSLIDDTTQEVIYTVAPETTQQNNAESWSLHCLTGNKYRLTLQGTLGYWDPYSFIFLHTILSQGEKEMVGRVKMDDILGMPQSYIFNIRYSVYPLQNWSYKMSTVPTNWYDSNTSDWAIGNSNNFIAPTNRVQLFKKTFSVDSLTNTAALVLNIRYKYGCVIYLNDNLIYNNGVNLPVSTTASVNNIYDTVVFRSVTIPKKTIAIGTTPSVTYLNTGENRIAIAIIASADSFTQVYFDCAIRILGRSEVSRVFVHTNSAVGILNSSIYAFLGYYAYNNYMTTCADNWWQIQFGDDRREWISSVMIQNWYEKNEKNVRKFAIEARNGNGAWIPIKTVTGLEWSYAAQEKKIWLENNESYNMYRFVNVGTGISSNCEWLINRVDMFSDDTSIEPPQLSYNQQVSIFRNIEMAEVYPNSPYYSNFSVSPAFPNGIKIDSATGMISGMTTTHDSSQLYTITATKYIGGSTTATLTLSVTTCKGSRSLITMTVRTDSFPAESSYKLYQGKGTTTVVASVDSFTKRNNLNYFDWCLDHNIYTIETIDNAASGWLPPAGYMLSVDIGTMRFDIGQVPSGSAPVKVTSVFSSFLPFQIDYDEWRILKADTTVATNWFDVAFDDSTWSAVLAKNIGKNEAITTYIRRSIIIPTLNDYHVLNVRTRFGGGLVAYFNGRRVARFNLEDNYNAESTGLVNRDPNVFSKFHIILATSGAVQGENVIAFEIHRAVAQSSASDVIFDATGVFGVNDCSVVVDSYAVNGTIPSSGSLNDLFSLSPLTSTSLPNAAGSYIMWTVENLEGSRFNSFGLHVPYVRSSVFFSLYGRHSDDFTSILEVLNTDIPAMKRINWDVPVGVASFNHFKFEYDNSAPLIVYITTIVTQYCKATGTVCAAIGDYPPVTEGQISPSICNYGYTGYSFRECHGGHLGEVDLSKCVYKVPTKMTYPVSSYTVVKDTKVSINAPDYGNLITKFYIDPETPLPTGLTVDESSGKIIGTPKTINSIKTYKIYGQNPKGAISTTINIRIKEGECRTDELFPSTTVGKSYTYDCSMIGSYLGSQSRTCNLGQKDGEWSKTSGVCFPVWLLLVIICAIIVALIVGLMMFQKKKRLENINSRGRRGSTKTVSGMSKKQLEKKPTTKNIAV